MSSSIMSKSGGNVNNRMAVENSATNSGQWYSVHGQPTPLVLLKPKANIALADQGSPTATSTMVLPRYHHSIIGGTCQVPLWGESLGSLQQLPRTESVGDSRSNYKGESVTVSPYLTDLQQHSQAPGQSHPPPLLTSNSKNGSSASWVSTGPSVLQTLQTPQSSHMLETQLPSLRPSFLSPKLTWLGSQQSAESIHATVNFPASVLLIRDYVGAAPQQVTQADLPDCRTQEFAFLRSADDHDLDPVSALLKAGEIIERNSRHRSGS